MFKSRKKYVALVLALTLALLQTFTMFAGATQSQGGAKIDVGTDVGAPVLDAGDAGDHIHGSTIVKLPNGEFMCAWFQGNGERDGFTTRIMAARKGAAPDAQWEEPFVLVDTKGIADINPALYVDSEDTLWLFWYPVLGSRWESSQPKYLKAPLGSYEKANGYDTVPKWSWQDAIYVKVGGNFSQGKESEKVDGGITSGVYNDPYTQLLNMKYKLFQAYAFKPVADGGAGVNQAMWGAEWTEFVGERLDLSLGNLFAAKKNVPYARRLGWQTKDKPFEMTWNGKNRMILPLYSDTMECAIMAITEDRGKTWEFSSPIIGYPAIQGSVLLKDDGKTLVCYLRDNGEAPQRVVTSESTDGGMTWDIGRDHQALFDPGVGSDLAELPNGNWVFVHNDNQFGRYSLAVALSEDEGKTWKHRRHLALDTRASGGSFHYPAIITDEEGNIHISYTVDYTSEDGELASHNHIKYFNATEEWIKEGDGAANKQVYAYERVEEVVDGTAMKDVTLVDNLVPIERLKTLALPQSIKAYLTYPEVLEDGMPDFAEIPIVWDGTNITNLQKAFGAGKWDEPITVTVAVDKEHLPEGITADMIPKTTLQMRIMITKN